MISEQAKTGFDRIFRKALLANIIESADDVCEIEAINDLDEISEDDFVILTITTTFFRLLTLFHIDNTIDNTDEIENYFVNSSCLSEAKDCTEVRDAIMEFCNICCGVMNRELHKYYHFLGMSTPYMLSKPSLDFISALNPGHVKHYRITINHSLVLHATLCICDYGDIDFTVGILGDEDNTGELELF